MSLIESLKKSLFGAQTKAPSFSVSSRSQWFDYASLADNQNYFDQFFGWTYKAIKTVADSTSKHKIKLVKGTEDEYKSVPDQESELMRDLKRFNAFQTYHEARWLTLVHKRLVGSAYWLIATSDDKNYKYEFYILNPTRMSLERDSFGLPKNYIYQTPEGGTHKIDPNDLIVFRDPDPADWLKGYSVLQASRFSHNSYELAMKFNMNIFGNMGTPEGFIVFDGISKVERRRVELMLRQKYGSVKNAGKTGVLSKLAQWLPITTAPRDLQFKENIVLMRDEILAFHGVPKPLVGLTDSTYTNSFEAQKIFQQYTTHPELLAETGVFNEQLIRKYYKMKAIPKDIFFICPNPVEANMTEVSEQATKLYTGNIITLDEARSMVGQESDPNNGTAYYYVNVAKTSPETNALKEQKTEQLKALETTVENMKKKLAKPLNEIQLKQKEDQLRNFFYQKSISNEKEIETVCQEYFKEQRDRVIAGLKPEKAEGINVTFNFDIDSEAKLAEQFFSDVYMLVARESLKTANEIVDGQFTLKEFTRKKLTKNMGIFAKEINTTTQEDLARIIDNSVKEGLSYKETSKQIKKLFDDYSNVGEDMKETRAKMIAITETNSIANTVYRATYAQSDIVSGMQWLSAHDSAVRPAHAKADFSVASKGQKFFVGGEYLEHPGDKNGSAENVIRCRCSVIPVIK